MHLRNRKRRILLGFTAGAAVLAMAGSAFACTETGGTIKVVGPGNSALYRGTGTDYNNPDWGYGLGFCEKPERVEFFTGADAKLDLSLTVEAVTDCPNAQNYNPLVPDGSLVASYEVRWINALSDTVDHGSNPETNCYTETPQVGNPWVPLGVMPVSINPSGPDGFFTYSLPATMRGPGNICLDAAPTEGFAADQVSTPMVFIKWTVI